jgi:hypothetical protein
MQRTKSNIKKTFIYQFETSFLIEQESDSVRFYFSDKDCLSETNKFLSNLVKNNVEIIYFNSQPSIVPSLYFDEKIDYKYLNTNTLISESIMTDTSSDKKIKVVYSISNELSELLIKNELEYSNNNYFTYLYDFLVNKVSKSSGLSFFVNLNNKSFDIIIFNNHEFIFFNSFKNLDENEFLYYLFFVLKNYEGSNEADKIIFLGKFEAFNNYYNIASKYSRIDFIEDHNEIKVLPDSPFFSIINENYIRN